MPTRLRSLLLAFAVSAIAVSAAAANPRPPADWVTSGLPDELKNAVAAADRWKSKRPASKRAVSKPTVGQRAATMALKAVGVPYQWGGSSLTGGFDCSGLVHWAYARLGIQLPHSSYALSRQGRSVARSRLKAGDVLFFSGLGHVGLYVGRGRMVHAPHSGRRVEVVTLARSDYGHRLVGARRVIPA
jgi:cell wall-associated NlpC family hydrolase